MPSAAQMNALKLDAPSIFQLMGRKSQSGEQALTIYKYNDDPVMSMEDARQNKDATFNSIFDIQAIQEIAESYNLTFSQHITLLPGLKTARILGNPDVIKEGAKILEVLKAETDNLNRQLQTRY
ncbi:hypothetical protein HPULCUR_011348 [Helicostylum pulchrum]|uniref:Uncharacterized protein n=1 Tax=Helicostylum pulchrum TaxID=562976 RepID=A0ABP9YHS0_9FUNG